MENDPKAVVAEVFPRMLEGLAFMFADPNESGALPGIPHDAVLVGIAFSGESHGNIEMGIGRSLGDEMVSNLMGIDPAPGNSKQVSDDALRELINVTCGHVLTSLAGNEPVFNLSIPEVHPMDGAAWDALIADKDTAVFEIDGRPVLIRLRLDT